jgi:hypothetical protein
MSAPLTQAKRPFDDPYLWRYSNEHLCYEVDHFFWLAPLFKGPSLTIVNTSCLTITGTSEVRGRLRNVLIEGAVIHFRNIVDFLFLTPSPNKPTDLRAKPTDVVAADFCASADAWEDLRGPISDSLKKARDRANKEVAHLTTDRQFGYPPEKNWDFQKLASELKPLLLLLSENALPNRLAPNVAEAIR